MCCWGVTSHARGAQAGDGLSKNYICVHETHPLKKYLKQCDGTVF